MSGATRERTGLYSSKVRQMLPPSPRGAASLMDLNTEPDVAMSHESLVVGWRTDPQVTREYVPEPLEVDGSGEMYLHTQRRWSFSGRNRTEFVSPELHTQTESFLKIPCTFEGQRYVFCSFSWGDRDRMVTAGRQVGLFHKYARIQLTEFHPFHPTWSGPHAGARVNVIVQNVGTVLRASVELARPVASGETLSVGIASGKDVPYVGHRYIYDPVTRTPIRNDLVAQLGGDRETSDMWTGAGWIRFYDAENEEVAQFEPREMLGGWWYRNRGIKGSGGGLRVVHDYGATNPWASRPRIRELLEAES